MPSRYDSTGVRTLRLRHPVAGLDRGRAFQDQPPYTTPHALNVFPSDGLTDRDRIGQRPGVVRSFAQQIGSGNPIRMLCTVSRVLQVAPQRWSDGLDAALSSSVFDTKVDGGSASSTYDAINGGLSFAEGLRTSLDLDTSKPYVIELDIARPITGFGGFNNFTTRVYFRYGNASPITADGTYVELYIANETSNVTATLYENGASVATNTYTAAPMTGGTLRVSVNDGGVAKKVVVNFDGSDRITYTLTNANSDSKQRLGFYASRGAFSPPENRATATEIRVVYTAKTPAAAAESTVTVAASNGLVYADNPGGTVVPGLLTQITQATVLAVSSDKRLMGADLLQKLYIADYKTKHLATGYSSSGANITGTDWTLLGIDTDEDVAIVTVVTGTGSSGVYRIASVGSTNLGLTGFSGTSTGGINIRIERAAKIYDPAHATQQLSIWTTTTGKGVVPHGCSIIARFSNRLVLGGDPQAPHVWYMSRRDDPLDFDYGAVATDKGRAIAGTSTGQSTIGQPLTAIIPFFADYCVFASASELWLMRGDPALSGGFDRLSGQMGVIDRFAWCTVPSGDLYFLSRHGLSALLESSPSALPTLISRDRLPQELLDIDTASVEVSLGYEPREDGVIITLTPTDGSAATHWLFSLRNKGFWPFTLPAAAQPRVLHNLSTQNPTLRLLHAGSDGYIRAFSRSQFYDDVPVLALANKIISSYCWYGPFGPSGSNNAVAALLHSIEGSVAAGSQNVAWSVYHGYDAEACVRSTTAFLAGTWTGGSSATQTIRQHIRRRGGAFAIKLASSDTTGTGTWAVESLSADIQMVGPLRV